MTRAAAADKDGPQLGISGRRLENGRVFSSVFQMGFVCPQLKLAYGLLWDVLNGASANANAKARKERFDYAARIIDEWVRTSDAPTAALDMGATSSAGVRLSHTAWSHGFGQRGCCPAGVAQGDGCLLVNHSLQCQDPSVKWSGAGAWVDDSGRFSEDPRSDPVVWVRRLAEGGSLVLQAAALLKTSSSSAANAKRAASWESWALAGADALLALQRSDGSWGRAYCRENASAASPPLDAEPLLDKTDTLFPVYFLADASRHEYAQAAQRYLAAAERGAELAWALYGRRALYTAGDYVPSNDKEAALFALRAYMSLAEASAPAVQPMWLQRAAATALIADTYHYQVDVPLAVDRPRAAPYSKYNDWARDWYEGQTTVGLGFIEVGHSGVDTTGSEFVPELLRLYDCIRLVILLRSKLSLLINFMNLLLALL